MVPIVVEGPLKWLCLRWCAIAADQSQWLAFTGSKEARARKKDTGLLPKTHVGGAPRFTDSPVHLRSAIEMNERERERTNIHTFRTVGIFKTAKSTPIDCDQPQSCAIWQYHNEGHKPPDSS
jgi:hypothetical protein